MAADGLQRRVVGAYALITWPTPIGEKQHEVDLFRAAVELDVGGHVCGCGDGPTRGDAARSAIASTLNQVGRLARSADHVADGGNALL